MRFVDLFSGGGFGAAGAVRAGGMPVLSVDAWDVATRTYKHNFPDARVECCDLSKTDPTRLKARKGMADVLLASPECTSHSVARGSRPANEKSRETALVVPRWAEVIAPEWIILENVLQLTNGERHKELMRQLTGLGYHFEAHKINAVDFGAPQSRRRLFLIGKKGKQPPNIDLAGYRKETTFTAGGIVQWDRWPMTPLYRPGRAEATLVRAERAMASLGRAKPFVLVYYGSDGSGGWQRLDAPLRTVTTLDRFAVVKWKGKTPYMRMLQPPELAAAMGAPDHRLEQGTRRDKVKLCGNGICAPVTEALFRAILENSTVKKAA